MTISIPLRILEWFSVRKRAPELEKLRDIVSPSPAVRLLDVGGGAGAATERFASGCGQVVILEPDARKVAHGKKRRPGIRFEQGHGGAIPFPDGTFNWVVSIVALHHMADQAKVLKEMRRVLTPSGRIAFLELPPTRAPGPLARRLACGPHADRMKFLAPEELKARLEAAGFRDVVTSAAVGSYLVTGAK